jgi:hypothetical protein
VNLSKASFQWYCLPLHDFCLKLAKESKAELVVHIIGNSGIFSELGLGNG